MLKRLLIFCLLTASSAHAQTRVLTGIDYGSSFGNLYAGIVGGIERPIGSRIELDPHATWMFAEQHYPYGTGTGYRAGLGGIVWVTKPVGVDAELVRSAYNVALLKKSAEYSHVGLIWRTAQPGIPMRFTFNYFQQVFGKLAADGTEPPFLKGGEFKLDMRVKCQGPLCYRLLFNAEIGHVLTQGNPVCDGTLGNTGGPNGGPCPRQGASAAAFTSSLQIEFPRRKATEEDRF